MPSEKSKRSLRVAALSYHAQLKQDDEAMRYLTEDRKFTKEAIAHFGLGVVRQPEGGHETFLNRISFPYVTVGGVTSIRFRYLGDHKLSGAQKFLGQIGNSARLYNVTSILDQAKVYVCEGETDTVAAWMAGLPAVGVPGVTSWKPPFARVFMNREVVVLADNDDSGEGKKFADQIYRSLDGCDTILMDRGYDVARYAAEFGIDKLREKVGAS